MAKIVDVRKHNGRYYFKVKGGDDFNDAILALKKTLHFTERGWNAETKEWDVAATEESERRLARVFENAETVFYGKKCQLPLL